MMKTLITALLAVALGVTSASAETLGQQSRLETTFGVIDLTPADGREAGFSIGAIESAFSLHVYVEGEVDKYLQDTVTGAEPWQFTLSHGAATASASFDGIPGQIAMSNSQSNERYTDTSAGGWQAVTITVAPHTLFTVSGRYVTDETATDTPGFDQYMSADISIYSELEHHQYTLRHDNGPTGHETSNYWLGFANRGNEAITISVTTQLLQQIRVAEVSPVPEPSTWAMLLAGLGITAAIARRRK